MKHNKILTVIGAIAMLANIFLVGCSGSQKEVIGIIGAMDVEVDSLKKAADIKNKTKIADMEFCEGTLEEKDVVIRFLYLLAYTDLKNGELGEKRIKRAQEHITELLSTVSDLII